jgi:hypothetical protein
LFISKQGRGKRKELDMAKILYEIDTDNLFDNTTAMQDKEVLKEFLSQMTDDMLVEEVVNRSLLSDVFCESRQTEQQTIIDEWADDFGYTKQEE